MTIWWYTTLHFPNEGWQNKSNGLMVGFRLFALEKGMKNCDVPVLLFYTNTATSAKGKQKVLRWIVWWSKLRVVCYGVYCFGFFLARPNSVPTNIIVWRRQSFDTEGSVWLTVKADFKSTKRRKEEEEKCVFEFFFSFFPAGPWMNGCFSSFFNRTAKSKHNVLCHQGQPCSALPVRSPGHMSEISSVGYRVFLWLCVCVLFVYGYGYR